MNSVSDRVAGRLPFFYGYVMASVAMIIQVATSPGQTFGVSAFIPSLRESLSLSDSKLSFAYMMGTLLAAIPLIVVGPLSDRFGLKRIVLISVVGLSLTCFFAAKISGFYTLMLAFFLLRFLGQGSLTLLSINTVAMWFRSRVGRVTAAMSIGTAMTFAWIPEWIQESIALIGWPATYQWIAAILGIGVLPLILVLFRNRPEDMDLRVDGTLADSMPNHHGLVTIDDHSLTMKQAMRSRAFYLVAATNTMWAMSGTGIVFYLFTLCEDRGFSSQIPADLFKTFGFSMLAMQLVGGVLADFLPLNRLLGIGSAMLCAGLALIGFGESVLSHHGYAVTFGAGQGMLISVSAVLWVRYYGREHLGSIRGATWCCTVAGSGCGPLMMGISRDQLGGFEPAIVLFLAVMSLLAILVWWATPPKSAHLRNE
jgi:OFA family oxalate/formate antiporter-like MFS transporter